MTNTVDIPPNTPGIFNSGYVLPDTLGTVHFLSNTLDPLGITNTLDFTHESAVAIPLILGIANIMTISPDAPDSSTLDHTLDTLGIPNGVDIPPDLLWNNYVVESTLDTVGISSTLDYTQNSLGIPNSLIFIAQIPWNAYVLDSTLHRCPGNLGMPNTVNILLILGMPNALDIHAGTLGTADAVGILLIF